MKFLLDTNIVCEPLAKKPDAGCVSWLESQAQGMLVTTTITLAEVWQGVLNLDDTDKRRPLLMRFSESLPKVFRMVGFDERAAKSWGEITRRGLSPLPVRDSLIAAIALSRRLTVVTRDQRPFKQAGCRTVNPFTG